MDFCKLILIMTLLLNHAAIRAVQTGNVVQLLERLPWMVVATLPAVTLEGTSFPSPAAAPGSTVQREAQNCVGFG